MRLSIVYFMFIIASTQIIASEQTAPSLPSLTQMQAKIAGGHVQAFSGHNLVSQLSQLLGTWKRSIETLIEFINKHLPQEIGTAHELKAISDTLIETITDNYNNNIKESAPIPPSKNPGKPLGIPTDPKYHDMISKLNFHDIYNTLQPLLLKQPELENIINNITSKSGELDTMGMPYKSYTLLKMTALLIRQSIEKIFNDYQKLVDIRVQKVRK